MSSPEPPEGLREKAEERSLADKLVSPNGFDGMGPVPQKVTEAAHRLASLRTKFVLQWTPGMDHPMTTREVEQLFDASLVQAEWGRELFEARDRLAEEVERLRRDAIELLVTAPDPGERGNNSRYGIAFRRLSRSARPDSKA